MSISLHQPADSRWAVQSRVHFPSSLSAALSREVFLLVDLKTELLQRAFRHACNSFRRWSACPASAEGDRIVLSFDKKSYLTVPQCPAVSRKCHQALPDQRKVRRADASSCMGPAVLEQTPVKPFLCQPRRKAVCLFQHSWERRPPNTNIS